MRAKSLFLSAALFALAAPAWAQMDTVDTTGVWYHLRHHDPAAAKTELDRLKQENPDWQPPADLLRALSGKPAAEPAPAQAPKKAAKARANPVDAQEKAIYAGRVDPDAIEALKDPMQKHRDAREAERVGKALLDTGHPDLAQPWLERAAAWSPPGSKLNQEARANIARAKDAIAKIQIAEAEGAARKAAAAHNWGLAEQLAAIAEAGGPSRIHTDLAWAAMEAQDPARAAGYFSAGPQNEESRYGRILALSRANAGLDTIAALCGPEDRSERIAQACGDAFASQTLAAYNAGQYDQVLALEARARSLGIAQPGTTVLAGWSLFHRGDYAGALQRFDAASSDPAASEGIAQSLMALGRYDELEARAATNPALGAPYRKQVGDLAVIRQRSALAASVEAPNTAGIEGPSVTAGFYDRAKSGGVGADKIDEQAGAVTFKTALGRDVLSGGVEAAWVSNGASANNATLATPWLKWERQQVDADYSATIGTSPIGGAISPLPALGLTGEKDWSGIIGTGSLKVQPRYDSILSMSGQRDPVTGQTWGRIVEIGPQLGGILLASDDISLSGQVAYGSLQGRDVAGNDHVATNLSASYSLRPGGFDYLRVGPFYAFDAYSRNEFLFTQGNGGYYSPQADHALGLFADFLTDQGKSWLVGGRVNGSWQYARQAAEGTFAGETSHELGTDTTLRGAVMLGHGLILGAFGRVTISPSGRDKAAGVTLTVPLFGRDGLFSDDLPHFIDRAWP